MTIASTQLPALRLCEQPVEHTGLGDERVKLAACPSPAKSKVTEAVACGQP
jgi:hypothetical protein